jgi:hypothetical protein
MSELDSVALDVVRAVASVDDADPATLRPPLADVVDPSALDRLYRNGTAPRVEFEYRDHDVTVLPSGEVRVDGEPTTTAPREVATDGVTVE